MLLNNSGCKISNIVICILLQRHPIEMAGYNMKVEVSTFANLRRQLSRTSRAWPNDNEYPCRHSSKDTYLKKNQCSVKFLNSPEYVNGVNFLLQ